MSNNKTWHLYTTINVRIKRLVLVVIIIVLVNKLKFEKRGRKLISQGLTQGLRLLLSMYNLHISMLAFEDQISTPNIMIYISSFMVSYLSSIILLILVVTNKQYKIPELHRQSPDAKVLC